MFRIFPKKIIYKTYYFTGGCGGWNIFLCGVTSPNGLNAAWFTGTTGLTRLSKLTSAAFSPKNDCGVFACGFFVNNESSKSKLLTGKTQK